MNCSAIRGFARSDKTIGEARCRRTTPLRLLLIAVAACFGSACASDDWSGDAAVRWRVVQSDEQVSIETGAISLAVSLDPFAISASDEQGERFLAEDAGLYVVRDATAHDVSAATGVSIGEDEVAFDVVFADGATGVVEFRSNGRADSLRVAVRPDDLAGVSAWGERLATPEDELIYGLTERIVDDYATSELFPAEIGSLDRKGETIEMWIKFTMSGYVPFHQSSYGYGILVEGFMPGDYDVAATDPSIVQFEFEWDPDADEGAFHIFHGPDHASIVDAYYDRTGYPPLPPVHVFRHWRGIDVHPIGTPVEVDGVAINAFAAMDLAIYREHDIPAGNYRFDRPWTMGQEGFAEWMFDPVRFPNAQAMLQIFADRGWHMHVFTAPWALGSLGDEADALGYLAPNSDRDAASRIFGVSVDFTNPAAVEWYKGNVLEFLAGPEGRFIDGFVMDRADEPDVSSEIDDIWYDGRNGRQIHNWYPVAYNRIYREIIDQARPENGYLLARAGYTGSQAYVMRWGGDTHGRDGPAIPEVDLPPEVSPSTDLGLRSVLISVQRAAFMGTPFWGSDIGGYNGWLDREVYGRWIEVGFASPLMRFHGRDDSPWNAPPDGSFDPELMDMYRGYIVLRHAMSDYLMQAARQAVDAATPMVRPLVFVWPDESGALNRWDQWMLGSDLLVAPVWKSGQRQRAVWIPPGRWVDFWDRCHVIEGPTEITVDVPLSKLPMWVPPDSALLDLAIDAALANRVPLRQSDQCESVR